VRSGLNQKRLHRQRHAPGHPGDKVRFELDAGRLIIAPISRRKYSLQELLAMQGDEPLVIDQAWDNMPTVGQEVPV
jgi:antitoxin component of MazEF toxin-antitoxin module